MMTEVASHGNIHHLARAYTAPLNHNHNHSHSGGGALAGGGGAVGSGSGSGGVYNIMGAAKGENVNANANGGSHAMNQNQNQSPGSLAHSQGHTSSNYSIQSQQSHSSGRSSDTTQGSAQSTLFPPPPPPLQPHHPANAVAPGGGAGAGGGHGGDVTATDNIMNSVADASSSLFQICVTLRQRLLGVPGFGESMIEVEQEADEDTDPVTLLWRTFRRGIPLLTLYNALRPAQPLVLGPGVRDDKRGKASTFKFIQACVNDLKFPQEECFIITDLYGDDTTGFVKVARVVNRVLDLLVSRGLIADRRPTATDFEQATKNLKKSQRQYIISELVTTERTYVQHLELLQAFKSHIEERGVIPGDSIHSIFLNLNSLLDFQRRFLIRVEQTNALPEEEQNWGKLFVLYCEAFKVYEPYIANQRRCERTVMSEWEKLRDAGGSSEMRQMVETSASLYGFLMKPMQRLSKYPLLLEDLYKRGDLDEERKADLLLGKEASTSSLTRANLAVDREEKAEAVQALKMRVEDWKGHRVEGFGALLLYGTFTVLKSENLGSGKDGERQYHVYLFETILLCCKDIDLSKPKNKLSSKNLVDKASGKPKLQLKGRIFMQNVTDLVSLAKPGSYTCQIFWKGDPSIENFIIRFVSEDAMKKWATQIEMQRRRYRQSDHSASSVSISSRGGYSVRNSGGSQHSQRTLGGGGGGVSATEFSFLAGQPALENPYTGDDDEEADDDDGGFADTDTLIGSNGGMSSWHTSKSSADHSIHSVHSAHSASDFSRSRQGSSTSLRSRSTTGGSGEHNQATPPTMLSSAASARAPGPGRLPNGFPAPLSLRTRELQQMGVAGSPGERGGVGAGGDSYFSPTVESPMSSRTSSSSISQGGGYMGGMMPGTYPFPRQQVPVSGPGYYEDGHGGTRFTAPAMGRPPMMQQREGSISGVSNGYAPPGRQPSGPIVMPRNPNTNVQNSGGLLPRNRSASTPDIHNNGKVSGTALRNGGGSVPAVPDVPGVYAQQMNGGVGMGGRSQSNSPVPVLGQGPGRVGTASPGLAVQGRPTPTDMRGMQSYTSSRTGTPVPAGARIGTPGAPQQPQHHQQNSQQQAILAEIAGPPTQLKVKVHCPSANQILTLVVPLNISYQSLKDRIDAKLQRSTNLSLNGERNPTNSSVGGQGRPEAQQVKLKYLDEEDFVSILSDEDVMTAFETWREQRGGGLEAGGVGLGGMGEIELFCQR